MAVQFPELSEFFRRKRGKGIGRHRLQAWQALGMPYIQERPGANVYFDPEACWAWYLEQFTVEKAG